MEEIEKILEKEIQDRCNRESNFFGPTAFNHIKSVRDNAEYLASKYENVDRDAVVIAAWLHDIASITDKKYYEEHHVYGANMAEEILNKLDFPKEKIELIKRCILNHRGSVLKEKLSKEEIVVADADAISHFDNVPELFYLAYIVRKLSHEEGKEFVKNKLERSYNKLSQDSKEIYKEKYRNVMSIFNVEN